MYGRGTGVWCKGGLRETAPCNPSEQEAAPEASLHSKEVDPESILSNIYIYTRIECD